MATFDTTVHVVDIYACLHVLQIFWKPDIIGNITTLVLDLSIL